MDLTNRMQDWLGWNFKDSIVLSSNFLEETGLGGLESWRIYTSEILNQNDFNRASVTTGYQVWDARFR